MKDSPSPPPPPDYSASAREQGAANLEAARATGRMSNPNIYGPLGNQLVSWDGDQPTVRQTLTPDAMATLASQQQVQKNLADLGVQGIGTARNILSTPFNPNLPGLKTGLDLSGVARMPVNAGTTGQQAIMSRLEPTLQRQDAALRQRLINQGLVPGGEAYNAEMEMAGQQRNDLLSQAAMQGLNLDIGANQQGFNQALQGTEFGNLAQQQSLAQQMALRNQPINEITGLMSGSQLTMPQFQGYQGTTVAPAPIFAGAQAAGNAAMQNYGIQQSGANAGMGGLFDLAGAGMSAAMSDPATAAKIAGLFSDRRLKSNIERIGTHPLNIGIYEYDIFGERQRGVMADEVEQVLPEAVIIHPSGYKMVDYGRL